MNPALGMMFYFGFKTGNFPGKNLILRHYIFFMFKLGNW